MFWRPTGDEEIFEPVVVVIAHGHAGEPALAGQAGLFGHVGEGAVAIVLVQAVGGARRSAIPAAAGEQQNVQPAIVVIIEERSAAADGFQI